VRRKTNYSKLHTNLILLMIVIVFSFLVLEFCLRVYIGQKYALNEFQSSDMELYEKSRILNLLESNKNFEHYKSITILNTAGFRGDEFEIAKNRARIIAIGDSFTFGWGINNTDNTWPKLLESKLNDKFGNSIEVLNFGVSGANILEIYWILKYRALKYSPDMIIYAYHYSDPEFFQQNLDPKYCIGLSNAGLYSIDFLKIYISNILYRADLTHSSPERFYPLINSNKYHGMNCVKNVLNKFDEISKTENIPVLMFIINPIENEIYAKTLNEMLEGSTVKFDKDFQKKFNEKKKLANVSNVMLAEEINQAHYNEFGNMLVSEVIYDSIMGRFQEG